MLACYYMKKIKINTMTKQTKLINGKGFKKSNQRPENSS